MNNELANFFGCLGLLSYLSYAEAARDSLPPPRRNTHYALATAFFVLALLSKPPAAVLLVMAGILDIAVVRRPLRQVALSLAPWAALALACLYISQKQQPHTIKDDVYITVPAWFRVVIAGDSLEFYLGKIFWPCRLAMDYGRYPLHVLQSGMEPYFAGLVPIATAVLLWLGRRRAPGLWMAGALFLAGVLPVIGLVPYYFQATSTVADRYMYLALIGPAFGFAWLLSRVPRRLLYPAGLGCVVLLGVLAFRTEAQDRVWRNSESLYRQAVDINPMSFTAHDNLGIMLAEQKRYADAFIVLRETVSKWPQDPGPREDLARALCNDGYVKGQQGGMAEAIGEFSEAIQVKPDFAMAHEYLGMARGMQGDWANSAAALQDAIRIDPNSASAHYGLGVALSRLGKIPDARAQLQEALRLKPEYPEAEAALRVVR
jgi:tetratricopeptide (TPR) repeat protein